MCSLSGTREKIQANLQLIMNQMSLNNLIFNNITKNKIEFLFCFIIVLTLILGAPIAFGDTVHFDSNGNIVDKIHYEILVAEREKIIKVKLRNGYSTEYAIWRDPIKLRKKRILQWKILRSLYNPDSLPDKIELE